MKEDRKKMKAQKGKGGKDQVGPLLTGIYVLFLFLGAAVIVKTALIQLTFNVKEGYEQYFHPQQKKAEVTPARGRILTCDGRPLAISVPYYDIYMDCTVRKQEFKDKPEQEQQWLDKADTLSRELAALFHDRTAAEYYGRIIRGRESGNTWLSIKKNVDLETLDTLKTFHLFNEHKYKGGLIVTEHDERIYPYDTLARRTIGQMKDNRQKGIEYSFNQYLHGTDGYEWQRITEGGKYVHDYDRDFRPAIEGCDVRTTLNIDFQAIADRALRKQIDQNSEVRAGIAIIMEANTGAIRAMVNLLRDTIPGSRLWERDNLILTQLGEMGSVMKTVTLVSLIEDGYVTLEQRIPCNNGYLKDIPQDKHVAGMKDISVVHGLEISSNYVFAKLADMYYGNDEQRWYDHLFSYGLGDTFAFDIDGLRKPLVHVPGSKYHYGNTLKTNAYGYGISITPLHLAMFYNAIANKGRMMKPYLVESVEKDGKVVKKFGPAFMNDICSKATADTVTRALRCVVTNGTGSANLKKAALPVAGKTGTSHSVLLSDESPRADDPYTDKFGRHKYQGTFVGFFPVDNPKYTILVTVYSYPSHKNFYGSDLPAKAIRDMVDQIYAIDDGWNETLRPVDGVPTMDAAPQDHVDGTVPDLRGLGLSDALWLAESLGLHCDYSGSGHVQSQNPAPGTKARDGQTITITLK